MTAAKWGKEIIGLTWQFVMDCWFSRNKTEHDTDNKPHTKKKEKLTEKILWIIGKLPSYVNHPYQLSTTEELTSLPLDNLTMTYENLVSIFSQTKTNMTQ
jgi:hypothetical protein